MLNDFFEEDEADEVIRALWERGEKGLTAPPVAEFVSADGMCRLQTASLLVGVPTYCGQPMIPAQPPPPPYDATVWH